MTTLSVHRLTTTLQDVPGSGTDARTVDRIMRAIADRELAARLHRLDLPAGEWCVRRVRTAVGYDPTEHEATLKAAWADSVVAALGRALEDAVAASSEEVVHYPTERDAVADVVVSLASDRSDRAWAWQQLGLVDSPDPDPRAAVLAVLARRPELALAVLRRALAAGLASALHRLLGREGWIRAAGVVAGAAGADAGVVALLGRTPAGDALAVPAWSDPSAVVAGAPAARAGDLAARSEVATQLVASGVRLDQPTALAWAVLVLADVDPAGVRRTGGSSRVVTLAAALAAATEPVGPGLVVHPSAPTPAASADRGRTDRAPHGASTPGATAAPGSSEPEPVPVPVPSDGLDPTGSEAVSASTNASADDTGEPDDRTASTVWGGLLFLLNTATAAGLPGALDQDDLLAARPTRWVVHQLAQRLVPLDEDDPAALALCGLAPGEAAPSGPAPDLDEDLALVRLAEHWRAVTLDVLPATDPAADPAEDSAAERLVALARRRADISGEPGWLDVRLDLSDVDVDVRIAGLDLDPGWVGWLGVVVRFGYG